MLHRLGFDVPRAPAAPAPAAPAPAAPAAAPIIVQGSGGGGSSSAGGAGGSGAGGAASGGGGRGPARDPRTEQALRAAVAALQQHKQRLVERG